MRIHTAHLSLGKQIPRGKGVMFLDVTRKSGGPFAQQYLAPSWELLQAYKRRQLTSEDYAVEYMAMLESVRAELLAKLTEILGKLQPTDLILGCYCGHGEFCHRHLLQRWLVANLSEVIAGWELQSGNLYQGDEPVSTIISVATTKEDRKALLQFMSTELGSHILLGVDDDRRVNDPVVDMQLENDLSAMILAKAKTQLIRRQGPLIDLTEFGTLNAMRHTYDESVANVVLSYPTKHEHPWHVVQGDYTACLTYLRAQRFAPTFEITPPVPNPDFADDMDRLYHYGLCSIKDNNDE